MTYGYIARAMLKKHGLRLARVKIGARAFRYEYVLPAIKGGYDAHDIARATLWRTVNRAVSTEHHGFKLSKYQLALLELRHLLLGRLAIH